VHVGVHVGESVAASVQPPVEPTEDEHAVPLDDPGFVDFAVAGSELAGEFRCADCGYGAVIHRTLPICPMCGSTVWEKRGPLDHA
jgi:rubrerythrin